MKDYAKGKFLENTMQAKYRKLFKSGSARLFGEQVPEALLEAVIVVLLAPDLVLCLHRTALHGCDRLGLLCVLGPQLGQLRFLSRLLQPHLHQDNVLSQTPPT